MTTRPTMTAPAAELDAAPSGIPFARLLRVEWGKAIDTRAARWLLGVTALITVAIMLLPMFSRRSIHQDYVTYLEFTALSLGTLLPVVSIMTLTGEWSQRTVLTTFAQEPRRSRVIGAKVVASGVLGVLAAGFGGVVTALALLVASARDRELDANLSASHALGYVLFLLMNVLMGVAFGALLHNTAAAIVIFFALPIAFGILGSAVDSVSQWLDPSRAFTWVLDGDWYGHVAKILLSTGLWIALPLAAGFLRTVRREIK